MGGLQALGGIPFLSGVKFHVEYIQNHVWGPLGARVMSIFVKAYFFPRTLWVRSMVKKSVKNYIEWCSQSAKRLIVGQRSEHILVRSYDDIMIA